MPEIDPSVYIAEGARITDQVIIKKGASIWLNAVLRGDEDEIVVGEDTNIQDNCTLHTDPGFPLIVGNRVTVAHNAVLHGCTVEDEVVVGMGAIVLNGAKLGKNSMVAAGAMVPEGMNVPEGHLALGVPARVVRPLAPQEIEANKALNQRYRKRAAENLKLDRGKLEK